MKIKKRISTRSTKFRASRKKTSLGSDQKVFFAVLLVILLVALLLLGVVFPNIKDILLAPGQDTDSASGVQLSMVMIMILIDIVLAVPLYMILSRIVTKRGK